MFVLLRWVLAGLLVGMMISSRDLAAQAQHTSPADTLDRLSLEDALVKFQNAWGVDLSYSAALLDGRWTHWDRPAHPSAEADLRALLQNTGVSFRRLPSGTFALTAPSTAAQAGSLAGYVLDQLKGTPLPRAHIRFVYSDLGTATNRSGLFAFSALPPGEYIILVSHIGYAPHARTVVIQPGQHVDLIIDLKNASTPLDPIIIEGPDLFDTPRPLSDALTDEELTQIKGLGTADLVQSMDAISGVRVGDATSDVHIQGGDRGEHQLLLDGGLVFEPVHLFGLLGAFNPFAIGRITVDKAGFSASKGSYLAGVIHAEHALIDTDRHPLDVQIDPLSLNARLNLSVGAPDGTRGEFMAAARTSVWDSYWSDLRSANIDSLLLAWNQPDPFLLRASLFPLRNVNPAGYNRLVQELDSIPPPALPDLGFTDVHLAGRLRFKGGTMLHTSYYRGGNKLHGRPLISPFDSTLQDVPNPDRYDWVNENVQLRGSFLPSRSTYLSAQVRSSLYYLTHEYSALDRKNARTIGGRPLFDLITSDDGNRIREIAASSTIDYAHWGGYLQTGMEWTRSRHRFTISDVFSRSIHHEESNWRLAAFAEERFTAIPRLTITGSARATYLASHQQVFAEPRLELRYIAPLGRFGTLSVRGAGGLYYQFLNQFEISTISPSTLFPSTRFWMPVDATLNPPKAYHLAGDIGLQFATNWSFRAEGYYKDQQRLLRIDYPSLWQPADEEAEDIPITTQDGFIKEAVGFAYGTALVLERASSTLRTAVRYEHNIAEREYAFRDSVRMEPVPWSEPNRLEFAVDWTPHPRFIATARWRGGWGRIWGFRQAYYDFLATDIRQGLTFDEFDFRRPTDPDHQLPSYQQLDLGVAYTQPLGPTALQLRVDVLNATDRRNVIDRNLLEVRRGDDIDLVQRERFLLPRTFSVSARLKW